MSQKNDTVLSFHDSVLYDSDIELLDGPYWLNDSIIGFYIEYLERNVYTGANVCFLRPEVTQCLKLSPPSELPVFLDPLNFKDKRLSVMPLNDCDSPLKVGGSHWSLLVYCKEENCFYHLDSSENTNIDQARLLSSKISRYLGHDELHCISLPSLQQSNSYDCGVFVLCNIDNVTKHYLRRGSLENIDLIKLSEVNKKRYDLKNIITSLNSSR